MASVSLAQEVPDTPVPAENVLIDDISQPIPAVGPSDAKSNGISAGKATVNVERALEKKRKASAGLAAVGGIAILGISIIAVTMIWAKRIRRLARDPLPAQRTTGNDFWFLKPPKPIAEDDGMTDIHRPPHPPTPTEPSA